MSLHRIFFYLTLIFLPTQLGKHFWPDWAMVLGRHIDYLAPTIYLTDITICLTLLFWFFSSLKKRVSFLKIRKTYISFLIFLFSCLFIFLNISLSSSPCVAIEKWIKTGELILFGIYIVHTKPDVSRSIWCLSIAVIYSSLLAICQFFLQHSIGGIFRFLGERTFTIDTPGIARINMCHLSSVMCQERLRPYGTFPHPNVLGGFLATTLPLIIFQPFKMFECVGSKKTWEIFRWTTIALGIIALITTFSRSAWVVFLLFMTYRSIVNHIPFSFLKKRTIRNIKPVSLCLFIVFVAMMFLAFSYFQSLTPENESVFVRKDLNHAALEMSFSHVPQSFFLGIGLGNFLVLLPKFTVSRHIFFLQPVHNIYLLLLSETGIIGLGTFIFLIWKTVGKNRKRKKNSYLFISLLLYLLLGFVDHYPLTLQQGQLLLTFFFASGYGEISGIRKNS